MKVKSRKPPGSVSVRTIHQGGSPAFLNLSQWLVKVLTPFADRASYLLRDTSDFVSRLSMVPIEAGYKQIFIDLKDFYLSGSCEVICSALANSQWFPDPSLRACVHESLAFLLQNPFV